MIKRVVIITNKTKDIDLSYTNQVKAYLNAHGVDCYMTVSNDLQDSSYAESYTKLDSIVEGTDAAIIIGGDGTLINAARDLLIKQIPILGINAGTVGFLSEIEVSNFHEALEHLLKGDYLIENRMTLSAFVSSARCEKSECNGEDFVINDVVISRSGLSRLIHLKVFVNGDEISEFHGDGIIVSTPTGSTAYNLSAGGPIIIPTARMTVITPICAHSLFSRSIVVQETDEIRIEIGHSSKKVDEEALITVDGVKAYPLKEGDYVTISQSAMKRNVPLIKLNKQSYFDLLRNKLGDREKK